MASPEFGNSFFGIVFGLVELPWGCTGEAARLKVFSTLSSKASFVCAARQATLFAEAGY